MFKNVTLEISLKPFKHTDDEYIKSVCRKMYLQWYALIKERETISVMLWSADGSELLEYNKNLDDEFEWCKYIGNANLPLVGDLPKSTPIHVRKQLYCENPPKMTYGILKKIAEAFKTEGKALFPSAKIEVGTTFDIGGEFAVSDFKYNKHKEILGSDGCQGVPFVDVTAELNADTASYAAYPHGIPDKTPFGEFFGAQANEFMTDMGFDFIWLSNGVGFASKPWDETGKIYDGKDFHTENLSNTKEKIMLFWDLFRKACPKFTIKTRGTNHSVGIDYASDGVPLYDIYKRDLNITPPPNSPWAALNDDVGIEVIGQLTRNCELPGDDYMFRYYLHDIWWLNSPWYDRYGGSPHDIYIPMALSVINESGEVKSPSLFNILSVDNAMGDLPDLCASESIPHFLKAEKDAPDKPSPFVLVYPFREYTTTENEEMLREMHSSDLFLKNAVNCGFPLATAVSADNFVKTPFDMYNESILLVPAMIDNEKAEEKIEEFSKLGGKIITYGSKNALKFVNYVSEKSDINDNVSSLFDAAKKYGYEIGFSTSDENSLPVLTIHRSDNAMLFSAYSRDTTVETKLNFPLGAPVLLGMSTNIENNTASYHFGKWTHNECRVFVKQNSGNVTAKEKAPENLVYRRRISISGLENAEVCLFGEEYCKEDCIVTRGEIWDPIPDNNWEVVRDKENGTYLHGKNVSGTIVFSMPRK